MDHRSVPRKASWKKWTAVFTLVFCLSQFAAPRSEALVGLIFKSRVIKAIGGIGALGGATFGAASYAGALVATDLGTMISLSLLTVWGVALGGLGVILLDDKNTVADIEFTSLDLNAPETYPGFSKLDAEIYNADLPLLNAIRQTVASEVSNNDDTQDAELLWQEYSSSLHPVTFEIAKMKAKVFVESLAR